MLRVDHVVPSIENPSAGPSQSIPAMCNGLVRAGVDVALHVLEKLPCGLADDFTFKAYAYPWSLGPSRLGRSAAMKRALAERAHKVDIIHNHSLWMAPNVYSGAAVAGTRCKLVCSPRGCLTKYSLSRSKWKKRLLWLMGQGAMMRRVDMFHATAESEYEDIRRLGFRQPVVLLPNGITMPPQSALHDRDTRTQHGRRTLIYLSRIHPEKRLDLLLRVWGRLEKECPDWDLKIYGPKEHEFARSMMTLSQSLGHQRVSFLGEVRDDAKWRAYAAADLFILPTRTENFGMAVAEALASGVPAITTKGAPWSGLKDHRCGWWVDESESGVSDALECAMSMSSVQLTEMGARGKVWMSQDFDWDVLGTKMRDAYRWLVSAGRQDKPEWILQ